MISCMYSHLGGYDSHCLCGVPLLHHWPTITATSKARLIFFHCDDTGWMVSWVLWGMFIHWGWGQRGRELDFSGVRWVRYQLCFLCTVIIDGGLLRKLHLTGQPKLRVLGERRRRQVFLQWRVQRFHANLWLRASRQVVGGAVFRHKEVTGSGEDSSETRHVFRRAEGRLREKK